MRQTWRADANAVLASVGHVDATTRVDTVHAVARAAAVVEVVVNGVGASTSWTMVVRTGSRPLIVLVTVEVTVERVVVVN